MSDANRPTVRSLLACDRIELNPTAPNRVDLVGVITYLRPKRTQTYPLVKDELAVFALLSECRGAGKVRLEIEFADTGTVIFRSADRELRFPNEPLVLHGYRAKLLGCRFAEPGLYLLKLLYDNQPLAETPIVLRTTQPTP